MGENIFVEEIPEILKQFFNDKGFLEVVIRDKDQKFKAFNKIFLKNTSTNEQKEAAKSLLDQIMKNNSLLNKEQLRLNEVIKNINQNSRFMDINFKELKNLVKMQQIPLDKCIAKIENVAKLQGFSVLLSGANLGATCAGFAIMYAKLDKISGEINKVMNAIKQSNKLQTNYEFNKVLSEHANMLDCRKTRKYYTEEQMRKLVDDEYNVLLMLIEALSENQTSDIDNLIYSIHSLASMLSVSIRYFDEIYYFNNKEAIGDGDVWHSSHDNWMSVYDKLSDEKIIKIIQDHGLLDLNLSSVETDAYYLSMFGSVADMVKDIQNNQRLIMTLDNEDALAAYYDYISKGVTDSIHEVFDDEMDILKDLKIEDSYREAMRQVGLAV